MGLCLSGLFLLAATNCDGLGEPTRSLAISRTTLGAEKVFFFRFFGIVRFLLRKLKCLAAASSSHLRIDSRKSAIIEQTESLFMEERDFFDEKQDKKPATLNCPHCHQSAEYEIQWLVRTKKKSLPPRADERDRAKFAKAQSYMLRRDDMMMCKNMRCRKRFEITGVQSVAFLD